MDAAQAKRTARDWIEASLWQWPGLRGAHLVGGITSMPDDAPFPPYKDVDVHLVFAEGSPALDIAGPFLNVLEVVHGGLTIEAGIKSLAEYRSADAVLANPEIAHHLTVESLLYDPDGLLRDLQAEVRRGYPRRRWVLARLEHERNGLAGALALRPLAAAGWGASGEVNLLGYTATFVAAALDVATLNPPRMGGRTYLRLRENLAAHDRLDLHEEVLALQGWGTSARSGSSSSCGRPPKPSTWPSRSSNRPTCSSASSIATSGRTSSIPVGACSTRGTTARPWAGSFSILSTPPTSS